MIFSVGVWVKNDEARNLWFDGAASSPPASMEYAAKGLIVPLVGMRDNDFIFISCAADPPQFFNLVSDHDDMRNLVDDQAFASQMLHLNGLVSAKWDLKRFDAEIGV